MTDNKQPHAQKSTPSNFEQQANQAELGIVAEFVDFLKHSKKWWLTPIIVVLLLIGGSTQRAASPLSGLFTL